jgi:acyl-CoA reductase-like NAD-dependent aldehyde dehydrogenase
MFEFVGLPPALVRQWSAALQARVETLLAEDVDAESDSIGLVSLPANTFTCLEACAGSARTVAALWVRPSAREPFSALRFVAAMLKAGWPAERLAFYGVDHATLTQLVPAVDRATLYGGPEVQRRYGGMTHVDVQGPGRAVAVVDADLGEGDAVAWLKELVAGNGGRFCTNVGTIVSMQAAEPLGLALAEELDAIVPADPIWPLAYGVATDEISRVSRLLSAAMSARDRRLTQRLMTSFAHGRPFFAPTLIFVAAPSNHPLIGLEHPFPVAVIANISPKDCSRYTAGAGFVHRYPHR